MHKEIHFEEWPSGLTLRARTVFLIFEKKKKKKKKNAGNFAVHLDGKILACFTENLVQNLMNLVLSSKSDRKWPKMAKTKIVQKNVYMWHLGPIG